jgi:hypothetical protein
VKPPTSWVWRWVAQLETRLAQRVRETRVVAVRFTGGLLRQGVRPRGAATPDR